jgi:hypothetical protein
MGKDIKTRIGRDIDESQDVQWPVDKIRLAGSKDVTKRDVGGGHTVTETTVVPWISALPNVADGEHGAK